MALIEAEAHLQGEAFADVWAWGRTLLQATPTGDSVLGASSSVAKRAQVSLQGTASTEATMMYLVYSDLQNSSSLMGNATLAASATSSLQGEASLEAVSQVTYSVETSVQGDSLIFAAPVSSYLAESLVQGDTQVTARPLPEDELAIDLYGRSMIEPVAQVLYEGASVLQGQGATTAVPMLRPAFLPAPVPSVTISEPRLVGYQPGRQASPKIDKLVVVTKR